MNLIWIIALFPTLCLLYTASIIVKGRGPKLTDYVTPLPRDPFRFRTGLGVPYGAHRKVTLISSRELREVTEEFQDIVFIDVRCSGSGESLPACAIYAFPVDQRELFEVLSWIPPETTIVLCGVSNLSKALIWSSRNIAGVAPVYIVTSDLFHLEAADENFRNA